MVNKYPIVQLGEVCDFVYGDGLKETDRKGGNVPVYGSNGIVGWHDKAITKGETLIIGRKGSIGEVHLSNISCWAIDTTYYIDKTKVPCDFTWLYYTLKALDLTRLNKSAAVPGLNRDDAYEQKIALPPLPEQKRIASLLKRADRLRQLRWTAHDLGDALLQSVFLEMFGDPLVNDKNWKIKNLRSVSSKFSDGPFGSDLKSDHYVLEGVRVIRLQNIGVGKLIDDDQAYISEEHFNKLSKHRCLPGDVIVGTLGDPNLRAMILPPSIPQALNKADCVQIRVNPKFCNNQFVCWLLNMPQTLQLASGMIHGQTRARINMGRLAELEVPVPPLSLQEQFASMVRRVESLRVRMAESTRQVEGLFESLLSESFV